MSRSNSSTSNSERSSGGTRELLRVGCWFVLWIALFDLSANLAFRAPQTPDAKSNSLQRYFEYGRSVEGKLRRLVKPDGRSGILARIGWTATPISEPQPARASGAERILVASYGQSFTQHIMEAAVQVDPRLELRLLGGPGAPLSHSFKLYQDDRHRHEAKLVVIGVLASTLPQLATMTTMTWGFEVPAPYMYPRYFVHGGRLEELTPSLTSLADLRDALREPARWSRFRNQLERYDAAFNPRVFDADPFDHSALARLCRRGLGQRNQRRFSARFHDETGFTNEQGILDVAEALLVEFARTAQSDGRLPFVLLFNDRGYSDDLYRALGPRLRAHGVAFLSSHEAAPPSDAQSFVQDGHFRPDLERRMAEAWLQDIRPALEQLR